MISDPRQYSIVYPDSNIIIKQAQMVLDDTLSLAELEKSIVNQLRENNDALINVALNLAPSFELSHTVWESLENAVNNSAKSAIFAIPVILVLGANNKTKLNATINTEKLNAFFVSKDIFAKKSDAFISGKLIDPLTISTIKPSQIYYWARNITNSKLWIPLEIPASPIEIKGEAVFLRFLVGVINSDSETNSLKTLINIDAFRNNAMELMQLINNDLKHENVTLFPIPFPPITLSSSYVIGNEKRIEIAISVALCNVVRKIREESLIPLAKISTAEDAIKIEIECVGNDKLKETSLWHLKRFEDFDKAHIIITQLLQDMQVEFTYE